MEKEGFRVTTSEEAGKMNLRAKNVVFCAPPTGNNQYADDVTRAVQEVGRKCSVMCYGNFALRLRMRMDDDGSCYQCKLLYTSPHPEISTQSIHAATSVSDVVIF